MLLLLLRLQRSSFWALLVHLRVVPAFALSVLVREEGEEGGEDEDDGSHEDVDPGARGVGLPLPDASVGRREQAQVG